MKIELKAIKYSAFASQETNCYQAKIYIDGKPFAGVSNDGRGGCDHVYPLPNCKDTKAWRDKLNAIEAELGQEVLTDTGGGNYITSMMNCLEFVCGDLMNEYHRMTEVKKILRRVSYLKPDGKLYQLPAKYKPDARTLAGVKACGWFTDDLTMISGQTPDDALKALTAAGFFKCVRNGLTTTVAAWHWPRLRPRHGIPATGAKTTKPNAAT